MKKMKFLMIVVCLLAFNNQSDAQFWKFKKKSRVSKESPQETKYDKLFKNKKVETEEGLIDLHKCDGKLYFEFPLNLLGKDMLLGTVVSEISDNSNALVGQKPHDPIHIKFSKRDSTICLLKVVNTIVYDEEDQIAEAVRYSNIDPIIKSFKIKTYNNDSTAVVFEVTKLFVSDNKYLDPFDPYSQNTYYGFVARTTNFQADKSFLDEIKSFESNISVKSYLSYKYDLNLMGMAYLTKGEPFTALVTRSIILLPDEKMKPRLADPRINYFTSSKIQFSSEDNKTKAINYAHRWRLEPKNVEAYKRGELVEPKKPILYYIDNAIPTAWVKYVKLGVLDWNKAFEKIGFKNAVQVKDFPTKEEDPEFDFANFKYSCIKYVPTLTKNSMGPSWTDPRTGEIINGTVYLYHNIVSLIHDWRMIQTGAVDKRARKFIFDEDFLGESIRYVVAHEVGHTLGLMHNMSASNAIPTDNLRDPDFTQKYGTTYSIMDYARNNYVAQPGDLEKGVKMTPPAIGKYDYFSIKWGYQPLYDVNTIEEEAKILEKWITEKSSDPAYRYGKQQFQATYDPRSQMEDLGDDAIKSSTYGIKNLKRILPQINSWIEEYDKDYTYITALYYGVVNQYATYLDHVASNIGGIYINEVYRDDNMPTHSAVSKHKQKESLKFIMSQIENMDWLRNQEIFSHMGITKDIVNTLKENTYKALLYKTNNVLLSANISDNPYTPEEFFNDIYQKTFGTTIRGESLKQYQMDCQKMFLGALLNTANVKEGSFVQVRNFRKNISGKIELPTEIKEYHRKYYGFDKCMIYNDCIDREKVQGFEFQQPVDPVTLANIEHLYYAFINKAYKLIKSKRYTGDKKTRMHYAFMIHKLDQFLND